MSSKQTWLNRANEYCRLAVSMSIPEAAKYRAKFTKGKKGKAKFLEAVRIVRERMRKEMLDEGKKQAEKRQWLESQKAKRPVQA